MPETAPLRSDDPERLGSYDLKGRLGEGGQGVVYLAAGPSGEHVAIKWLRPELTGDPSMRDRFLREVSSAKRVAPFCTAQVIESGIEGDRPYMISEFIDGPSLQRRVMTSGPISGSALHRLAVGTATALTAIHQAGVVHRDLKPANVIMGPDGPRVIDFGIARALDSSATLTSRPVGTPAYMAPEQIMGHQVGPPADLFAWACTIIYAASGNSPFGSDTLPAVINRILNSTPSVGELDGPLRDIVNSCLAKDPRMRPTAEQVLLRLLQNPAPGPANLEKGAAEASASGPAAPSQVSAAPAQPYTHPGAPAPGTRPYPATVPSQYAPPSNQYPPPPNQYGPNQYPPLSNQYPPPSISLPGNPLVTAPGATPKRVGLIAAVVGVAVVIVVVVVAVALRGGGTTTTAGGSTSPTPSEQESSSPPSESPSPYPSPTSSGVATDSLTETKLPGIDATIYENPADPVRLTYYEVEGETKNTWTNYPRSLDDDTFKKDVKYWQLAISPNGKLAAGRTKNYTSDNYHGVDIVDRTTGVARTVKTVKRPLTYEYAEWSKDSRKVLMSIRNPGGSTWTTKGFIVVDAVSGTATVRQINDSSIKQGRFYWSGDESTVATYFESGGDKGIRFYDLYGDVVRTLTNVGTPYNTSGGLFSPSGDWMVTMCRDSTSQTCVWDSVTGVERTRFSSDCTKVLGWWDEQHVFCWTGTVAGNTSVAVVDLQGTKVRKLLDSTQSEDLGPYYTRRSGTG